MSKKSIKTVEPSPCPAASYTYDANSNELTAALNGTVYKSSVYNSANLPTAVYYPNSGDDTNRIEYTYRVNGNMHSHRDWLDYTAARIYNYDGAGRLIMDFSALEDENYTDRYTYDTRGNILTRERTDRSVSPNVITTTTYTYDRANKLLSSTDGTNTTTYAYDGIGNMTSVTENGTVSKSYSYDNFERLISSTVDGTTTAYTYDGDNLRQTKTTNGVTTQHILDGMNVVADIKGSDVTTFTRGNGLVFGKNNGVRTTYNNYSNGGTAQLVKPDGTFTEYTYTAYGEIKYNSTDNTNPFTYCGEYTDVETGLVYLRNRYYDPELGRFLTQDPIKDGLNWYAYCNGDPVNRIDMLGLYYLETDENGNVYAVIEEGDTLAGIAKAEVNDESAWTKMGYEGDPGNLQIGERVNITGIYNENYPISLAQSQSLPKTGEPNSTGTLYNPDGSIKQKRVYGPDGNPMYDDDYNHAGDGHGIGYPHRHPWNNGKRQQDPIPVPSIDSSTTNTSMIIVGGIITIAEIISQFYGFPLDIPGN